MRLLVLQPRVIFPADGGAKLYSVNLWRRMAERHDVTMLVPCRSDDEPGDIARMDDICTRSIAVPWREAPASGPRFCWALFKALFSGLPYTILKYRSRRMMAEAARLLGQGGFDAIVADRLPTMGNVPSQTPCPVVLIDHNVEALVFRRFADRETRPVAHGYLGLQAKRLERFEQAACRRADLCIALSQIDLEALDVNGSVGRGAVVPPGVDLEFFRPLDRPPEPHSIVFCGSMDSWQNVNCVQWFTSEVLPRVQQELPDASLTIVGRDPRPSVWSLAETCSNVHVTGRVDDVRPHVADAEVFVVPLRFGSGVRLKIFEALAMRKAVVSTSIGAEGTPFEDGTHLLLADTAAAMAAATTKLMKGPAYRARIEQAGYEYVTEHCGWDKAAERLEDALAELIASAAQRRGNSK